MSFIYKLTPKKRSLPLTGDSTSPSLRCIFFGDGNSGASPAESRFIPMLPFFFPCFIPPPSFTSAPSNTSSSSWYSGCSVMKRDISRVSENVRLFGIELKSRFLVSTIVIHHSSFFSALLRNFKGYRDKETRNWTSISNNSLVKIDDTLLVYTSLMIVCSFYQSRIILLI